MFDKNKVLDIAVAEVGYVGKSTADKLDDKRAGTKGNYTKYARELDAIANFYNGKKQGFDFCDVFVDWCFVKAFGAEAAKKLLNQPERSYGAGCGWSKSYFEAAGRFYKTPQVGDQIFFGTSKSCYHTGLVYRIDGNKIYTIEGNAAPDLTVESDGHMVCLRLYKATDSRILGYGRPDWAGAGGAAAYVPKVGDKVIYSGTVHYSNANATTGKSCKGGPAKVTGYAKGSKHPWQLIRTLGGGASVYGWVDEGTFYKA